MCEVTGIIGEGSVIASGVIMASGKKIFDEDTNDFVAPLECVVGEKVLPLLFLLLTGLQSEVQYPIKKEHTTRCRNLKADLRDSATMRHFEKQGILAIEIMSKLLKRARETLKIEIAGLEELSKRLDNKFEQAVNLLYDCRGKVILLNGQKWPYCPENCRNTTSTGTPSLFLHAGESSHGDLGIITRKDAQYIFLQW